MEKNYLTASPSQTRKIGEILAKKIIRMSKAKNGPEKKALILGLEGDLGGGKTTFLQGFAKGLGFKEKILSPTFIIIRKSKIKNPKSKYQNLYHIDCYRIEKPKEILNLGFKEIISNPKNIVAIEWAEKIRKNIPRKAILIKFEFINKTTRKIVLK